LLCSPDRIHEGTGYLDGTSSPGPEVHLHDIGTGVLPKLNSNSMQQQQQHAPKLGAHVQQTSSKSKSSVRILFLFVFFFCAECTGPPCALRSLVYVLHACPQFITESQKLNDKPPERDKAGGYACRPSFLRPLRWQYSCRLGMAAQRAHAEHLRDRIAIALPGCAQNRATVPMQPAMDRLYPWIGSGCRSAATTGVSGSLLVRTASSMRVSQCHLQLF
jgi:hypothetical protein